ncbi:MAG: FAD-dependent oxidoreductase [Clostridiales bacterium]|nr:FAD-dependent oxidoreductase [Clostridiales bacterium]
MSYDALFSPIKLRGLELKNRVVLPGMNTKMVKNKHDVADDLAIYHGVRAAGGCALNIVEPACVCPETHAYLYLGLYNEHHRDELKKVTKAIHDNGGLACVQIWHGGFVPEAFFDKTNKRETPDTITHERIQEIIKQYGVSAKLAVEAGFDALEFHAAHTYLPHEFMNPSLNNRTDEYGNQSLENRCRFNLEVIREMRANMPEDMPLLMRLDAIDELMPKVTTLEETIQFINWAAEAGVDAADLSRGNAMSLATVYEVPPYNLEPGFNMDNIAAVKAGISIPVIGVGRVNTPDVADKLISEGKIDMIAVGRGQLVDPEWCNKAKEGRDNEIRLCIGCTQGCYDKVVDPKATHITCTRNPMLCLEYKGLPKTESPKNVMVIGAGIGGLLCAEFLKARGHNPTVYEASDEVGGQFVLAGKAPKKGEFTKAVLWEAEECKRRGIEIKTGVTVTPELIAEVKPDHVIIATGAHYVTPQIPGLDGADVVTAEDVLAGKVMPKGEVVILGGGGVGCETAQYLIANGVKDVRVMDAKRVGNGMGMLRTMFLDIEYPGDTIKKSNKSKVTSVEDHTLNYKFTDKFKKTSDKSRHFDTLVVAFGTVSRPTADLTAKCEELGIAYNVIGDAKEVRMGLDATADAYAVALTV